jgi:hypothetical protein
MNIFSNYDMPFYKFGDILFLQKISRDDWITFIARQFMSTGKQISEQLCAKIADTMHNHPYYVQQYSHQVWLRTETECTEGILNEALDELIDQLSLLFTNIIDSLTARQISFLLAIIEGVTNFTAKATLQKYNLGTSANVKNLKHALLEKDLIDLLSQHKIELQDPVFLLWLKRYFLS